MKSIVEEVLSRSGTMRAQTQSPMANIGGETAAEDLELEQVLRTLKTNIKVVGCGGAGSNTISRLVDTGVPSVELYAANTDAQHLLTTNSPHKILLGRRCTRGLGAGALPQVGEEAAREAEEEIRNHLSGADMVFVTCGLGGGTGTGSAPYVAQIAKELGALTLAIVTYPFKAEGSIRQQNAEYGLQKLRNFADTVIVIPNDKLLELVPRAPLDQAFRIADEVLVHSIVGIIDIITKPGLVNLDFNDLKTIMRGGGVAMISLGESDSDQRAEEAIEEALSSPLVEVDISEANGALVNVTGGADMTVGEAQKVAEIVQSRINPNARIIWGAAVDPTLDDHSLKVMVVITGVKSKQIMGRTESVARAPAKEIGLDFIQ